MDSTFDLLTAMLLPDVGPRTVRDLSEGGPLADALARPEEHEDLLSGRARAALRSGEARRAAAEERDRAEALGVSIVGRDDAEYPPLLRRVYDPPPVLYVRGCLEPGEGGEAVAVVGARAASAEGRAHARALARDLARAGLTIVSGLARGIDTAAHEGALDAGGRTVAVLGSGLDRVYPPENAGLAARIAARGAVVSEFRLGMAPAPGHFPRRNRVIAGWGRAVVVAEAAARSGALVTARCALEEGREVLAVPGHPTRPGAEGVNQLLRDGAALVRHASDVAEELGLVTPLTAALAPPADDVLGALRPDAPASLDDLVERCGRPAGELLGRLAELELERRVRRLPGALFVRS
ncbi:MAG: DNA-protecting protein DprA [Acidobacteria bacterium]|nr:DNA-protecting protein DprA [Acidobacteriota bacterium]